MKSGLLHCLCIKIRAGNRKKPFFLTRFFLLVQSESHLNVKLALKFLTSFCPIHLMILFCFLLQMLPLDIHVAIWRTDCFSNCVAVWKTCQTQLGKCVTSSAKMHLIHTVLLSGNWILFCVGEKVFLSCMQGFGEKFVYRCCRKLQRDW